MASYGDVSDIWDHFAIEHKSNAEGFVYFLHDPIVQAVKYGYTSNLERRMAQYASKYPNPLTIIKIIKASPIDERRIGLLVGVARLKYTHEWCEDHIMLPQIERGYIEPAVWWPRCGQTGCKHFYECRRRPHPVHMARRKHTTRYKPSETFTCFTCQCEIPIPTEMLSEASDRVST